jgi:hypothetical protein
MKAILASPFGRETTLQLRMPFLFLKVSKDKKWSVKDWMTTPLSRTISVILTVSHLKIKEPATLSLAHLSKYDKK